MTDSEPHPRHLNEQTKAQTFTNVCGFACLCVFLFFVLVQSSLRRILLVVDKSHGWTDVFATEKKNGPG